MSWLGPTLNLMLLTAQKSDNQFAGLQQGFKGNAMIDKVASDVSKFAFAPGGADPGALFSSGYMDKLNAFDKQFGMDSIKFGALEKAYVQQMEGAKKLQEKNFELDGKLNMMA